MGQVRISEQRISKSGINRPSLSGWPTEPRLHVRSTCTGNSVKKILSALSLSRCTVCAVYIARQFSVRSDSLASTEPWVQPTSTGTWFALGHLCLLLHILLHIFISRLTICEAFKKRFFRSVRSRGEHVLLSRITSSRLEFRSPCFSLLLCNKPLFFPRLFRIYPKQLLFSDVGPGPWMSTKQWIQWQSFVPLWYFDFLNFPITGHFGLTWNVGICATVGNMNLRPICHGAKNVTKISKKFVQIFSIIGFNWTKHKLKKQKRWIEIHESFKLKDGFWRIMFHVDLIAQNRPFCASGLLVFS